MRASYFRKNPNLICMVVPHFDRIGGYELQAFNLSQAYQRMGKKVFILTTQSEGYPRFEKRECIDIYRFPHEIGRKRHLLKSLIYLFWKLKELPGIIHCHAISPFTEQVFRVNQYLKIPTVLKVATEGDITRLKGELLHEGKLGISRQGYYKQLYFISINANIRQELLDFSIQADRIIPIPNGVDSERFAPVSESEKCRLKRELGVEEKTHLITFIGRFEERKRVEDLIQAWAKIEWCYPQYHLMLVGEGEQKSFCQQLCQRLNLQERTTFTGLQLHIDKILKASDLFVFPSRLEGLPNVVLEAMSTGLPVLSTNISGINELIEHGKTGWLVPPQNEEALIKGFHHLLLNPHKAKAMGIAARQRILSCYCFKQVVSQFFELYQNINF